MNDKSIVVGKRVPVGAGIGGAITAVAAIWDAVNPDNPLPAAAVSGISTFMVMIVQIVVANRYGITTCNDQG